jgi:hypothetical protein
MWIAKKHFWMSEVWVPPPVVETITAKDFPMGYLPSPIKAQELASKVSGTTILLASQEYPRRLIKAGKAAELRGKFSS